MTTNYTIKVVGLLWQGCNGGTEKCLKHKPTDITSITSLKSEFGGFEDFDMITDFQTTEITENSKWVGKKFVTTRTEEVISEFIFPESNKYFVED